MEKNEKKIRIILLFITFIVNSFIGCSSTKYLATEKLIQEEEVTVSEKYIIRAYITNSISDPEYARLFINDTEVFRCRGANKISFKIEKNTLTIYTNGNLEYEYDRIQKDSYKELQIVYKEKQ